MATLKYWQRFEVSIDGVLKYGGSLSAPKEITVSEDYIDRTQTLSDGTTWDAWLAGTEEAVTSFSFGWVEVDTSGAFLELVTDSNNGVGRVAAAYELRADMAWPLPLDDSMANYTVDFAAGTEDVIDAIRIRNDTGGNVRARLVLFA